MAAPSPPRSPALTPAAVPTPRRSPSTAATLATLTPSESGTPYAAIPTSPSFTDALMTHLLAPEPTPTPSAKTPTTTPHDLPLTALPTPLHSPLRTHKSPIPGIYLTHPGGWLEGSAPPPSAVARLVHTFLDRAEQTGRTGPRQMPADLEAAVAGEVEALRARMRERQAAREHNEGVDKALRELVMGREMERQVEEMARRKRAAGDAA